MLDTVHEVFHRTWNQVYFGVTHYLPPLLVAVLMVLAAWVVAHTARFLVARLVKGLAADRFLRRTGFSNLVRPEGDLRTGPLVARALFWFLFLGGVLSAISVFESQWTARLVEAVIVLMPKIFTAGVILLGGLWLSLYLSRSVLLWACEEHLPAPKRWASAVRVVVMFTAVVVAADVLNFASAVFFAAFLMLVGSAALGAALAVGLGGQDAVRRWISRDQRAAEAACEEETSVWKHL
jgi:hypothetical protein